MKVAQKFCASGSNSEKHFGVINTEFITLNENTTVMKRFVYLSVITFCLLNLTPFLSAQEFPRQSNGFVYDAKTMSKLNYIVDSLNQEFVECQLNPVYHSLGQARVRILKFEADPDEIFKALKKGLVYDSLVAQYTPTEVLDNRLMLRDYEPHEDEVYQYMAIRPNGYSVFKWQTNDPKRLVKAGDWVFIKTYRSVKVAYLLEDIQTQSLPPSYARMIGYADCMVDTTTTIFTNDRSGYSYEYEESNLEFIYKAVNDEKEPKRKLYKTDEEFYRAIYSFNERKKKKVDKAISNDPELRKRLSSIALKSLEKGGSSEYLETLTEKHVSPEMALALKRSRQVWGSCSMDSRPRDHALEIARLSAETTNWSIFLRSHLDLMNDNFSRASDGNYAWAGRMTYMRELESLDINTLDLLLGIVLRYENPAEHHYFGSNRRIARAIAESDNREEHLNVLFSAIEDTDLDLYNRLCVTYLAMNYLAQLEKEEKNPATVSRTVEAIKSLPDYLQEDLLDYLD